MIEKKLWFKIEKNQIIICIFAKPNAKKTAIIAVKDNALHIALHAKPQEGEANKALILFLAKWLKVPKTQISLLSGEQSRYKRISFPLSESALQLLNNIADPSVN